MLNYLFMFILGFLIGYINLFFVKKWVVKEDITFKIFPVINGLVVSLIPTLIGQITYADIFFYTVFLSILILISFIDFHIMIIPNKIIAVGLGFGLIYRLVGSIISDDYMFLGYGLIGMLIGFFAFFLIIILSGGKMGAGDAKLMALIGLVFGFESIFFTTFFGSVFALLVMLPIMIYKKYNFKLKIPFGPFLTYGLLFMIFARFFWSSFYNVNL